VSPDPAAILPVRRTHQQARAAYDRLSRWYDALAGSSERPFRAAVLEMLALQPGETLLEVGCGTGSGLANLVSPAYPPLHRIGLDLSSGMLREARRKLARPLVAPGDTRLACADAVHLPLPSSRVDVVFFSFTLELFDTPEIPLVLAEAQRVLRPGGRLGVAALSREAGSAQRPDLPVRIYEWFHTHFESLADCRPIYAARSLQAAGFELRACRSAPMWGLPVEVIVGEKRPDL
jgi:ubiquinone/menaquinone biosynthesis C-methylase UbiE